MDLSDFIAASIEEITTGLIQAQEEVSKHKVDIKTAGGEAGYSEVDFDIAVTTKHSQDTKGKAKLSVLGMGLELGKEGEKQDTTVSRIQFSVQLSIPEEQMKLAAKGTNKAEKSA